MVISERPQSHQVKLLFCTAHFNLQFSDKRTENKRILNWTVQACLNLICQQLVHGSNSGLLYDGYNSWWTWINQPNVITCTLLWCSDNKHIVLLHGSKVHLMEKHSTTATGVYIPCTVLKKKAHNWHILGVDCSQPSEILEAKCTSKD